MPSPSFGERRIYYNNFASHLLNAYNPNMLYPGLPHQWSREAWRRCFAMVADFGYNVFEFWLVPRLFCRAGETEPFGKEFQRTMQTVIEEAHEAGLKVQMMAGLATVGSDWKTYCPNIRSEWDEIQRLWNSWTKLLPNLDIVGIFPGDPGACSLNGCTATTYIDKSIEISEVITKNIPGAEIDFGTWGPPFFGWGIIEGPAGWNNEFLQEYQHTAWQFTKERMDRSMTHLLHRLEDFPRNTVVSINMGFNPDGIPDGENSGIPWAQEIAKTNRIQSWDFSLTEGENSVIPHFRFEKLFEKRRLERNSAPYSGGICFTMTPGLNQLSIFEAAVSFGNPDADPVETAREFYVSLFGTQGAGIVDYLPIFEIIPDWGNYAEPDLSIEEIHSSATNLRELLDSCTSTVKESRPLFPGVENYRQELSWFADLFAKLSSKSPDFDGLYRIYWEKVYAIYDHLPEHVDPRPKQATENIINAFRFFGKEKQDPIAGKWTE